jgi:WD40 repeat protein
MKSLEKDRTRRYETANDLAQDIYRHLSDEPVVAGPPDTVYRVRKFFRRNRTLVTGAGIVLLVLLAGIVVSTIFAVGQSHARRQADGLRATAEAATVKEKSARVEAVVARDRAQSAEKVAEEKRQQAQRLLAESQIDRGVRLLNEGDCLGLLDLLEARITADAIPDLRDQASRLWAIAYDLSSDRLVQVFGDGGGHQLVFSPDDKLLATAEGNTAQLWDTATGQPHGPVLHLERFIDMIAFSPDGRLLATHSLEGVSRLWDTATGKPAGPVLQTNGSLDRSAGREYNSVNVRWSAAFNPNGKLLATASLDGTVGLWETDSGRPYGQPIQHESQVWTVAFSPDGTLLASGSEDGTVRLWEVASIKPYGSVLHHNNPIRKVAFSPEGTLVATMTWGGAFIQLWETRTGQLQKQLLHEVPGWTTDLSFSPDGKLLAASEGWMARLWDTETGEERESLHHEAPIQSVAFNPEGRLFATGSRGWITQLWDLNKNRPYGQPLHHNGTVDRVVFSHDGQYLASRSWPGTARLWRTFQPLRTEVVPGQVGHKSLSDYDEKSPVTLGIMSDGGIGAIISRETVRLWDPKTFRAIGKPLRHDNRVRVVSFSPDKSLLAVGPFGDTVRLWEVATGRHFGPPLKVKNAEMIAFSPDGKLLAVGSASWRAMVFSTNTGQLLHNLGCEGGLESAAFNQDGTVLATASANGVVQLWDMASGRQIAFLIQPGAGLWAVRFSPDGNVLATASGEEGRAVRLWDLSVGPPYHSLDFPAQAVGGNKTLEAFSTHGTIMIQMLPGARARVWRLPKKPTNLREMQLKTWIALGLQRNQQGELTMVQSGQWHRLRQALTRKLQASNPQLVDVHDSSDSLNIKLVWTPASDAVAHKVYFGADPNRLKFMGKVEDPCYANLPALDRDTTYWWRVDTVKSDGSEVKGILWTSQTGKMVGWWKFDETEGREVADSSGNGLNGELMGDARIVEDAERGSVLSLDGDGDYVDCGNNSIFDVTDEITVSAWAYIYTVPHNWMTIISKGEPAWRLSTMQSERRFHFGIKGEPYPAGTFSGGTIVGAAQWHHICGTFDGSNLCLYVDGTAEQYVDMIEGAKQVAYDGPIETNHRPVFIGENPVQPGRGWHGLIDDVRIYSYALSPAEVATVYAGEEPKPRDKPKWFVSEVPDRQYTPPESEPGKDDRYYVPLEAEQDPREHEQLSIEELKILGSVLKGSEQSEYDFYTCALAHLGVGDIGGYRERCTEFLKSFEGTDNPAVAHWAAWTCALATEAVEDFNNVIELAELTVEKGGISDQNLNTLGAVLYRAGRFDEAVQKLSELAAEWEQGKELPITTSPAYTWFFLAMAHHQLGNADESQKYFDLAVKRSEEETAGNLPWNRRLTLQLLRKESTKLLGVPQ